MITKINKEPTREELIDLHKNIFYNDVSIPSNLGGGVNGIFVFALTREQYKENASNKYETPKPPGKTTVDLDKSMTKNQMT